ncbi:ribonuclease H-like domain-containing protein [Tanacetum coccineum]
MTKPTSEQGFLSDVYEQKTHNTLNTCLYACFLSQTEPTSIAKALFDSSWVEAMQEELLQTLTAYASFMGFVVYEMDVKSAFLYGTIEEEVYVTQPPGFKDPNHPDKVYKVVKEHAEILKKFNYTDVKSASTPVDLEKPLVKDGDADDVDVHLYRSMIWSLMYLIASRPDIMFVVFAYTDSDYTEATQDRKSTTGGCQFLGNRLISWQCKKQTMVATSIIEAEYVAIASCCGQDKQIEYLMLNASPLKHVKRGRDTKIAQSSGPPVKVGDKAIHKELGDRMERAADKCKIHISVNTKNDPK